ncbi:HAD family hydrolase [Sediminicoccus sp. BL-A-41-H5]|uniref:HAD family hydrolase n=1 Tax=Sediminicoccus sp. BL-A-41-H5 TaxID=3421106 RepID=UPI003D672276
MADPFLPASRRALIAGLAAALVASEAAAQEAPPRDPLPSWRDGPVKRAILTTIRRTARAGSPDFVPPAERVAVFDNDGTLWVEQPLYPQLALSVERLKEITARDPALLQRPVVKAAVEGDLATVLSSGERALAELAALASAGMSQVQFNRLVTHWLSTTPHPRFNRPHMRLIYQPMLEVMRLLRREGFAVWIVTGGEQEFVRAFSNATYGVPIERVVGAVTLTEFRLDGARSSALYRLPAIDGVDVGPGKPIGIGRFIGRRPQIAFGNSDGDIEMLQYATSAPGARLGMLVHHDDGAREYAYDRDSHVGRLDRGLGLAQQWGWPLISMKNDWLRVFPAG